MPSRYDKQDYFCLSPRTSFTRGLEDGRRVGENERHYQVLPVSRRRIEGRLPLVAFLYPHQVVGIPEVQLGEIGRSLQEVERRVH